LIIEINGLWPEGHALYIVLAVVCFIKK